MLCEIENHLFNPNYVLSVSWANKELKTVRISMREGQDIFLEGISLETVSKKILSEVYKKEFSPKEVEQKVK